MPKPMKLLVEVEELAFGRVFRTLDNMPGVALLTIISEGVKVPSTAATPKRGGNANVAVPHIVLGELAKGTQKNRDELRTALKKLGRAETSLPSCLQKLRGAKEIARIGSGRAVKYALTARGRARWQEYSKAQQSAAAVKE